MRWRGLLLLSPTLAARAGDCCVVGVGEREGENILRSEDIIFAPRFGVRLLGDGVALACFVVPLCKQPEEVSTNQTIASRLSYPVGLPTVEDR